MKPVYNDHLMGYFSAFCTHTVQSCARYRTILRPLTIHDWATSQPMTVDVMDAYVSSIQSHIDGLVQKDVTPVH